MTPRSDQPNEQDFAELDFENAVDLTRRRQIYARKPKTARDLINVIMVRRGIAAEQSNRALRDDWDAVVGPDTAGQTRPTSIRRGTLEVIVSNSSLLQMLSLEQHRLLAELNLKNPNAAIKKLRFRIGSVN